MIGLGGGLVGDLKPGVYVCWGDVAPHRVSRWSGLTGVVTGLEDIGGSGCTTGGGVGTVGVVLSTVSDAHD